MTEKPTVGFLLFGAFPSDRIPKAMKDVNAHFFNHSSNSCKLYKRIPANYNKEFKEMFDPAVYILGSYL